MHLFIEGCQLGLKLSPLVGLPALDIRLIFAHLGDVFLDVEKLFCVDGHRLGLLLDDILEVFQDAVVALEANRVLYLKALFEV